MPERRPPNACSTAADESKQSNYFDLPIAILMWRLRLCGSAVAIAFVMAGESVGLLFTASVIVAALLFCAGSALARLELRIRTIRTERRR